MEIIRPRTKSAATIDATQTLPLYRSAPALEVRLEDFELYAIDRLRVLKGIADGLSRGKKPKEMDTVIHDLWETNMRHPITSEAYNKDIISHFVLRLVYCRTDELRKWFLSMETTLFRYRFRLNKSLDAQRALMGEFGLPYKAIGNAELKSVSNKLSQVALSIGLTFSNDTLFLKVPFEEVPELVAGRRVYIHKGYAFVAMNQVGSLVATHFRSHLSKALVLTSRKWTSTIREQEKGRLTPIVEALSTSYLGPDYSQPKEFGEISVEDIEKVANSSFPLCMRHLFEKASSFFFFKRGPPFKTPRKDATGPFSEGNFFNTFYLVQGVGLKLEDALAFWKAEFSPKVGAEKFDKEYAYSIRHIYGKEGKRTDYTPYSCSKIISSTPGVGDHHGCPYRYFRSEMSYNRGAGSLDGIPFGKGSILSTKLKPHVHVDFVLPSSTMCLHGASLEYKQPKDSLSHTLDNEWRFINPVSKNGDIGSKCSNVEKSNESLDCVPSGVVEDIITSTTCQAIDISALECLDKGDKWVSSSEDSGGLSFIGKEVGETSKIGESVHVVGVVCEENLRAALDKMGVRGRPMTDVMDKVRNRHYQLACTLTFEAIHSSSCDAGINHPNQYFSDSQKILQSKNLST
ncbi:hypothetical protein GIB67_038795 [Kingdonia uniflora]|uniref:DNA primase large subunit C-terminal domain-containing protein n=1 Tax=Kingdonia uniflora TaxID=39325 RepID=A0A7J7M0V6_9MAGN|nr:hypothetical protein GIB67_038795 [Kingdonia uniflora]